MDSLQGLYRASAFVICQRRASLELKVFTVCDGSEHEVDEVRSGTEDVIGYTVQMTGEGDVLFF